MSVIANKEKHLKLTQIPEINEQEYILPQQSANVLFKFMQKLDHLTDALKHKAIIPRYCEENIEYLDIDSLKKISIPMSCFCDIHLTKLHMHNEKYGRFGIGLKKQWGIQQGVQPIHYINEHSPLRNDFRHLFAYALRQSDQKDSEQFDLYNNYLLSHLFYMKPLSGPMLVNDNMEPRNFTDEKEWRYIPEIQQVNTELPQVIKKPQFLNSKSYYMHSEGIRKVPELWLHFELSDIKHIIVDNELSRLRLIEFLFDERIINETKEGYLFASKIMAYDEMMEDW